MLQTLWGEAELIAEAETFVAKILPLIEHDQEFDIINGAAGCMAALLSLYQYRPTYQVLDAAIQCGNHLVGNAQSMSPGKGWVAGGMSKPLSGFSHGAAGMAWVLLELATLTGEQRFRSIALDAIIYERSLFSPIAQNWLDLREFEKAIQAKAFNQEICATAWCHGAPGIGLARLWSLVHLRDDAEVLTEIDIALKTTLKRGFGDNHCLCHGDLGNLELLLQASQIFQTPDWAAEVNRLATSILTRLKEQGWRCGVSLDIEVPGLMTGLAGIGYQLLRLADPVHIPSVLQLSNAQKMVAQDNCHHGVAE